MESANLYKKTEVGVIPEDWEVLCIEDICLTNGLVRGPFGGTLKKEYFTKNGYKVYEQRNAIYQDIKIGDYYIDDNKFSELKRFEVKPGDFIVSCSGTIGKIFEIPKNYKRGIINQALLKIRTNTNKVNNGFFYHYFNWSEFQKRILDNTQGGAMQNIVGMPILRKILFPLPPLPEQKAIAKVLSDVDELITSIEKLIDKKQKIKQGTMQLLLTGKKRLPGFTGEWEVRNLGEVADVRKGQLITEKNAVSGNIPVIGGGKQPSYYHNKPNKTGETITISASGAYAGYVSFYDIPIFASDCSTIGSSDTYSIEYIYYYLHSKQEKIYNMQTGGAQPHIYPRDIQLIAILLPPLQEQKAIAQILSDMDSEIEALQQKLEKYKLIKEGMMEKLLTGKVRLNE